MRGRTGIAADASVFPLHLWILKFEGARGVAFPTKSSDLRLTGNEEANKGCQAVFALKLLTFHAERQARTEASRVATGPAKCWTTGRDKAAGLCLGSKMRAR